MTDERYNELMHDPSQEKCLTTEELTEGWHWCYEFDGLLRNNHEDDYQCTCEIPKE